ncbi:MAG: XRE family transcriptional regulator [Lachnospiraceae bacterium]|nr:XRE family transcriptional regulator [Lachnospiraceae bacterium]MBO5353374.1 XRE family transcriptional regulator [Lachnospiraceae bacterium]MBQ7066772.1 XRE family transcriptional regulator [Lachnospiraceae bacterium]
MLSTGDKILNIMKDMEISIPELSGMSGVRESVIMDILAGVKEGDITTLCKIADGLGVCVHELCPDEENYAVPVEKDTLAKLIVISEINGVDLNELIDSILNRGIVENGFYD